MPSPASSRQFYLDWLRVISIFLVFVYHSLRIFGREGFHINSANAYVAIDNLGVVLTSVGMPLIFLVAGASAYFSLNKYSSGRYIKDRALRLLVPFAAGLLTHIPVLVYLERVNHEDFSGSYLDFLPHYFEGLYGFGGNFAWMGLHLWFLMMLFLYTLISLPVLAAMRRGRFLESAGRFLARPGAIYLLAVPLVVLSLWLHPDTFGIRVFGGWNIFIYLVLLLYGFVIVSSGEIRERVERDRWLSLAATILFLAGGARIWSGEGQLAYGTPRYLLFFTVQSLGAWCGLLAIWGFSSRHLNFGTLSLYLANEAVLPFYVLHQTVLIIVGFFVVQWSIPDWLKFAVIFMGSLAIIAGLYWFLIRPFNVMRFLFGMRPKPAKQSALSAEPKGKIAA
jgi:hypothetical protein